MRITRVYTRRGDGGETGLVGNRRVAKDSARIDAYGTVDELNATLGIVRTLNRESTRDPVTRDQLEQELKRIQNELFVVGSDLATRVEDRWDGMPLIEVSHVAALEKLIDELSKELEPLKEFILPGGNLVAAFLHLARTVCRRAERICVALQREERIGEPIVPYLNRLSDVLFVLARWISKRSGEPEPMWER